MRAIAAETERPARRSWRRQGKRASSEHVSRQTSSVSAPPFTSLCAQDPHRWRGGPSAAVAGRRSPRGCGVGAVASGGRRPGSPARACGRASRDKGFAALLLWTSAANYAFFISSSHRALSGGGNCGGIVKTVRLRPSARRQDAVMSGGASRPPRLCLRGGGGGSDGRPRALRPCLRAGSSVRSEGAGERAAAVVYWPLMFPTLGAGSHLGISSTSISSR